jgi:hypothetical protein
LVQILKRNIFGVFRSAGCRTAGGEISLIRGAQLAGEQQRIVGSIQTDKPSTSSTGISKS